MAVAQEIQREPIRIAYDASAGCPDFEAFAARVKARSSRLRMAEPGEPARTFAVTLVDGNPATGELLIVDGDRVDSARSVQADTCAEAAEAMALIVGVAANPIRKAQTAAAAPPAPPPVRRAAPPHPRRPRVHRRPARPVEVIAREETPDQAPAERPPPPGYAYAGADFALSTGVTPDALVGGAPYFGWQARDEGVLAPEFRLALLRSMSSVAAGPGQTATFEWTVGRLDGCPIAWRRRDLRVAACARIEAGAIHVDSTAVPEPRAPISGWFAAGPVVRAQRLLVDPLFADLEVAALVRATNDRFVVLPATTLYEVPLFGVSTGLGVGALFP